MTNLVMASSPHIRTKDSAQRIMLDVVLALLPAAVAAVILYGGQALVIMLVCVASAVAAEALFNLCVKKKQSIGDLSAVVTGLLLALNLSTAVKLWQCVVGAVFAIVLVKCMFGGMGKNFANPAITGRVFMLIAFPTVAGGVAPKLVDAVSGATPLEVLAAGGTEGLPSLLEMLLGLRGGAMGEGCIVALLIGFAYLVARKVIKWYVPAAFAGTVFVCFLLTGNGFGYALYQVLAGGVVLGAVFMATDYVTTPITNSGRVVFAVGCGLITFAIRKFFAYPEGVSFSILTMNLLVPAIEWVTAKAPLGGSKHGK